MSNAPRNTTTRDRDRATIRRTEAPCHICGYPIDYAIPSPDPMSFEVDHVIPLARGGVDELANKAASHRVCNRAKWHTLAEDNAPRTFITARTW